MGGSSTTRQVSETKLPKWLEAAGPEVYGYAKGFYNTPYQPYTGQRVADFSADQNAAFGGVRDYISGFTDNTGANIAAVNSYGSAPAQQVGTERVVDESGRLGAISDYINPFISGSLAPAIRDIETSASRERNRVGGMATMAGAFGDARHGIAESDVNRNAQTAIGDVSARAYTQAFQDALAQRAGDLGRFLQTDTANAGYNEQALQRQITGATTAQGMQSQGQNDAITRWMTLLGTGALQQQQGQNALDTQYEAYTAEQRDAYDRLATLVSSLSGIPHGQTTTSTSTQPNNAWATVLGGFLGAL